MDIQNCSAMLKTTSFDSLPKDVGVNSRKIVLEGPDFDFAMVISFATFSSFMSLYSIKYAPIIFVLFLLESSYMTT